MWLVSAMLRSLLQEVVSPVLYADRSLVLHAFVQGSRVTLLLQTLPKDVFGGVTGPLRFVHYSSQTYCKNWEPTELKQSRRILRWQR